MLARALLRELDNAMKSPRGDYYQGDIANPHRALHIVERHVAAALQEPRGLLHAIADRLDAIVDNQAYPLGQRLPLHPIANELRARAGSPAPAATPRVCSFTENEALPVDERRCIAHGNLYPCLLAANRPATTPLDGPFCAICGRLAALAGWRACVDSSREERT